MSMTDDSIDTICVISIKL